MQARCCKLWHHTCWRCTFCCAAIGVCRLSSRRCYTHLTHAVDGSTEARLLCPAPAVPQGSEAHQLSEAVAASERELGEAQAAGAAAQEKKAEMVAAAKVGNGAGG